MILTKAIADIIDDFATIFAFSGEYYVFCDDRKFDNRVKS